MMEVLLDTEYIPIVIGEKWELFGKYLYIAVSQNTDDNEEKWLNIILMKNYVLTVHKYPIEAIDMVFQRIEAEGKLRNVTHVKKKDSWSIEELGSDSSNALEIHSTSYKYADMTRKESYKSLEQLSDTSQQYFVSSADWIFYALLDAMVDDIIPSVNGLILEAESLDEIHIQLGTGDFEDLLQRINSSKRKVSALKRVLSPKQSLLTFLVSRDLPFLTKTIQTYLRDVLDHAQISLHKLNIVTEILNQTHSNFMAKISVDMAASAQKTDKFMNRMTALATILAPMSLVSGIFGMNVTVCSRVFLIPQGSWANKF